MAFWLDVPSGVLGEAQIIDVDADNEDKYIAKDGGYYLGGLTATIEYSCGRFNGTIASKTTNEKVTWTPPIELAEENPTGNHVYVTLSLTIYSGSKVIGQDSADVFYSIPSTVAPSFTVEFSDAAGYKDIFGDFLQLRSKLKIKVNPTTLYGATVEYCKINVRGESFDDLEAVASEIDLHGDIQIYVLIQDSRGKTAQGHFYVYFREYSLPSVRSLTVRRCNSDGTSNDQGNYVRVDYTASATTLDNLNTVAYKLEYKKSNASAFTAVNLTEYTNNFYISDTYIFAAETGSSYNVQLTVTDAFGSVVRTTLASTAATIMHFKADGKGIGLGKVSEVVNAVDIGWNIQMNSHRIVGLADPVDDGDAVSKKFLEEAIGDVVPDEDGNWPMFDVIWPVGSIYISANSTSPAELFGGEWSQIKDRFLLAAGSTYTLGKTGGEATHTLTVDEMPTHDHGGVRRVNNSKSGSSSTGASSGSGDASNETNDKGGGKPHNNMPPYLVVNVWMRTG